jgi:hypothetical protein
MGANMSKPNNEEWAKQKTTIYDSYHWSKLDDDKLTITAACDIKGIPRGWTSRIESIKDRLTIIINWAKGINCGKSVFIDDTRMILLGDIIGLQNRLKKLKLSDSMKEIIDLSIAVGQNVERLAIRAGGHENNADYGDKRKKLEGDARKAKQNHANDRYADIRRQLDEMQSKNRHLSRDAAKRMLADKCIGKPGYSYGSIRRADEAAKKNNK